jgi:hypothetical protein
MVRLKSRRKIRKGGVETRSQRAARLREELLSELEGMRMGAPARRTRRAAIAIAKKMGTEKDVGRLTEGIPLDDPGALSPSATDRAATASEPGSVGRGRRRKTRRRH